MRKLVFIFTFFVSVSLFAQTAMNVINDTPIDICVQVLASNTCSPYSADYSFGPVTINGGDNMVFNNGIGAMGYVYQVRIVTVNCSNSCTNSSIDMGYSIGTYSGPLSDCSSGSYTANWYGTTACQDVEVVVN